VLYPAALSELKSPLSPWAPEWPKKEIGQQRPRYQEFTESAISKPEIITERALFRMNVWGNLATILNRNAMAQIPR
jgi:hypothetical protein